MTERERPIEAMAKRVVRPIRIEGNIAYVPLTRGHEAIIDSADVRLVEGFAWHVEIKASGIAYARRSRKVTENANGNVLMHKVLLSAPDGMVVDHANRNGLDNRRSNLRIASASENMRNSKTQRNNRSGLKGVTWSPEKQRWRGRIFIDGKLRCLGYHCSPEEAHAAYCAAAAAAYGNFARSS